MLAEMGVLIWHSAMGKFGIMAVMTKSLVNTSPAPEPCFDPVPECSTCQMHARVAASAWRLGGVLWWLEYDIKGERHVARDHAGASAEEVARIRGFGW